MRGAISDSIGNTRKRWGSFKFVRRIRPGFRQSSQLRLRRLPFLGAIAATDQVTSRSETMPRFSGFLRGSHGAFPGVRHRSRFLTVTFCGDHGSERLMNTSAGSDSPLTLMPVHLEKCKICGEWLNRLSLEEVIRHLDHSRDRNSDTAVLDLSDPARAGLN